MKKTKKDAQQDQKIAQLEKTSNANDAKHDEALENQAGINKYVSNELKENAENDQIHSKAIEKIMRQHKTDIEDVIAWQNKATTVIALIGIMSLASLIMSIIF